MFTEKLHEIGLRVTEETKTQNLLLVEAMELALDIVLQALQLIGEARLPFENERQDAKMASKHLSLLFASNCVLTADQERQCLLHGYYSQAAVLHRVLAEETCKAAFYATFPDEARKVIATELQREPKPEDMAQKLGLRDYGRVFGMLSGFAHASIGPRLKLWTGNSTEGLTELNPWPHYRETYFQPLASDFARQLLIVALNLETPFVNVLTAAASWQERKLALQESVDAALHETGEAASPQ